MFQKLEDSPTGPVSPPGMNQNQMERVATSAKGKAIKQERQHSGPRGVRLVPGGPMSYEKKKANSAWLVGHLRAQQRLYGYEVEAYKTLATYEKIRKKWRSA